MDLRSLTQTLARDSDPTRRRILGSIGAAVVTIAMGGQARAASPQGSSFPNRTASGQYGYIDGVTGASGTRRYQWVWVRGRTSR